jgi:CRP/FNR family transcriptional regulator, cyclic AMP receptor protein
VNAERLAAVPLFAKLPENELRAIAEVAGERELAAGDVLTRERESGHCLFAIESGTADVMCDGAKLRTVAAGDVIGEIAVLAAGRRSATVVATAPMRLITFFKRDVWALEEEAPEASRLLRGLLETREIPAGKSVLHAGVRSCVAAARKTSRFARASSSAASPRTSASGSR